MNLEPVSPSQGAANAQSGVATSGDVIIVESDGGTQTGQAGTQLASTETGAGAPIIVGQKAFLYEESASGAVKFDSQVVWSTLRQAPETGMTPEPVIQGTLEVPEKGLNMSLLIKRNIDEGVSASHIIEIKFNPQTNFSDGNVQDLSRVVMKPTEQDNGERLIGAIVPDVASQGKFLVGLDNLPAAKATNEHLLLNSGWIDIVLVYSSGRRALVTLEKGVSGNTAFNRAFDSWKNL